MRTEYVIEIYNKHNDSFIKQIDVFNTYEEANVYAKKNVNIDDDSEYIEIIEIEYDEDDIEKEISRVGLCVT